MTMTRDGSSTATSKRTKRKAPTTAEDGAADRHRDRHPPTAASAGAGAVVSSLWTEEMHSTFLDRMEAAFVHDILFGWPAAAGHGAEDHHRLHQHPQQQKQSTSTTTADDTPRLDRYMPDSAESTLDGHGKGAPLGSEVKRCRVRSIRRNGCLAGGKSTTWKLAVVSDRQSIS